MENTNISKKELNKMLKENNYKIPNENINSFVALKNINKIYPNGVQAVYDFSLDINKNEFIVFVGPSGCGKSTTLRMIAGLEDITSGYLYIDKVLSNYVASKDRDISMVFQNYALYPQMTVYENIAFPLRARKYKMPHIADNLIAVNQAIDILNNRLNDYLKAKEEANDKDITFSTKIEYIATKLNVSDEAIKFLNKNKEINDSNKESILSSLNQLEVSQKDKYLSKGYSINDNYQLSLNGEAQFISRKYKEQEIRQKVFEAASILDLGSYLDRRPAELSGGQMQRVALGRAIVRNAKLFLMDEPLSNLDAKLRVQMRSEIVRIHEQIGATTIYVTHDQTEAMTMADRIVVMSKGWVQQIGEPEGIYNHPNNIFVATFIGSPAMNIFNGTYDKGVITLNNGYQIKLSNDTIKRHDQYFKNKIIDLKRLIETEDFLKLKALKEIDKVLFAGLEELDSDFIREQTAKIIQLSSSFEKDENYQKALENLKNYPINQGFDGKIKHLYIQIRKHLLSLNNISSADLGKLHNAQMFSNHEVVDNDTLYYQKPKKKKKEYAHKYNLHSNSIEFENNLYDVAISLLDKCEKSLSGPHSIRIGVRPEDIHVDESFNSHKTTPFNVTTNMVELLGSELLLYFSWANQDVIAKVSTDRLIKPHSDVTLTINEEKIHIFDDACGDTI